MDFYQCSGSRTRFGVRVEFARSPDLIEEDPMALYMYQGAYTAESLAAQIKEPIASK
jgi:hypothetical protein